MKLSKKILDFLEEHNSLKNYLLIVDVFLVTLAIISYNLGLLPFRNLGDFIFLLFIVFLFALYRPGWSFLFFVGFIGIETISLAPNEAGIMLRPYQIIGSLTFIALGIRLLSKRINFDLPKIIWQDWVLLVFSLAGFFSAMFSPSKGVSLKHSIIIFSFFALYFLSRIFIQNLKDIKKIIPIFLCSSFVILLYSIWQNIRFLKGASHFEVMPGRPNGTFSEADWLGIFVAFLLSVLHVISYSLYKKINFNEISYLPRDFFKAFFVWVMIIASYVVLIMTASRSAWLGAGIVAAIFLAYVLREKRYILIGFTLGSFLFGVGLVYVFNLTNFELGNRIQSTGSGKQEITISCASDENLPNFVENINELKTHGCRHINLEEIAAEKLKERTVLRIYRNDPNVSIRSEIYKKSWEEIRKSPIVGIGWGNISGILGKDGRGAGLNSSNIFLEIWLGAGLIGLIAFLIFLGNIFYKIFEATGEWRLFLALSLMAILIPNLFNAGIMLGFLWVYLAITQIKN